MTVANSVLVTLACDHSRLIKVNAQFSSIMCFKCNGPRPLKEVNVQEWHVVCHDCKYSRWVGFSSVTGNQIANSHCRSNFCYEQFDCVLEN